MSKTRLQKEELLKKYKDLLETRSGYLLVSSDSIDTATVTDLKIKLKELDADISVLKNSIFKIALQDKDEPVEIQDFDGATALITFWEDPTQPAKLVKEIQEETKLLEAKGGVFKGEYLSSQRVMQLAEIPTRDELLGQMIGSISSPISGFMNALTGNVRGLTMVLKGISEKKA